jgi:AbrB family looped-hinge helix DNA binding protein
LEVLEQGAWEEPFAFLYFLIECKAMTQATLSQKNQIVVPREARQALGAKPGDKLLVVVRGPVVIILQKPAAHQPAIRGIGRGVYKEGYLQKERQSWD